MPIYEYMKGGKTHYYYAFEVKDRNGKRKTIKERGFTGKTAAREAERLARVEWDKGTYIDPLGKLTVGSFMLQWLEDEQDISPETRETNQSHLKVHIIPQIGNMPLQKFTVHDIKDFVKHLQKEDTELAEGTIKKIYNLLQTAFASATIEKLINLNPFDLMDKSCNIPKVNKVNHDYWTKEEVKQFFSRLDHRLNIMFILAIYTGMRRGEIIGLRWKDIDLESGRISIRQTLKPRGRIKDGGKNVNATRSITLSPFVMSELKKHRAMIVKERWGAAERYRKESELEHAQNNYKNLDLVICQTNGDPVSVGNFNKFWKGIVDKTEMRYIKFHDFKTYMRFASAEQRHPSKGRTGIARTFINSNNARHLLAHATEHAGRSR